MSVPIRSGSEQNGEKDVKGHQRRFEAAHVCFSLNSRHIAASHRSATEARRLNRRDWGQLGASKGCRLRQRNRRRLPADSSLFLDRGSVSSLYAPTLNHPGNIAPQPKHASP
jgi:hypothetical protein